MMLYSTHTWDLVWALESKKPALREVDLEPSAKRGTERTEALVSLH